MGAPCGEPHTRKETHTHGLRQATTHHVGVRDVQTSQLRHDQEQGQHSRAAGVEEILPLVSDSPAAQRDSLTAAPRQRAVGPFTLTPWRWSI
jgi:hypothetical protein